MKRLLLFILLCTKLNAQYIEHIDYVRNDASAIKTLTFEVYMEVFGSVVRKSCKSIKALWKLKGLISLHKTLLLLI